MLARWLSGEAGSRQVQRIVRDRASEHVAISRSKTVPVEPAAYLGVLENGPASHRLRQILRRQSPGLSWVSLVLDLWIDPPVEWEHRRRQSDQGVGLAAGRGRYLGG